MPRPRALRLRFFTGSSSSSSSPLLPPRSARSLRRSFSSLSCSRSLRSSSSCSRRLRASSSRLRSSSRLFHSLMRSTSPLSLSLSLLEVEGGRSGFDLRPRGLGGGFSAGFLPRGGFLMDTSESEADEEDEEEDDDGDGCAVTTGSSLAPSESALESESEADGTFWGQAEPVGCFFLRPPRGARRGARAIVFFSGVKSWSLVFSDSDGLSESSSDGETLA